MIRKREFENFKNLLFRKQNFFFFLIMVLVFLIDRLTKNIILTKFNENSYFLNNYLNIDLIWNIGIGFGFLSTESTLLYSIVTTLIGLIIIVLIYVLILSENIDKFIYSLIIGGALGNFYDRLIFKAVPDFIDLHYNNFHWFTFNFADIFITVGIIIFILRGLVLKNREQ
jgi:signal peptidase II